MEVSFSLLSQLQGIKYVNIYYGLMQQKRVYYMVLFWEKENSEDES